MQRKITIANIISQISPSIFLRLFLSSDCDKQTDEKDPLILEVSNNYVADW